MQTPSPMIAVAGGSGFVGRAVVGALRGAGFRVAILARGQRPVANEPGLELRRCDLGLLADRPLDPNLLDGCAVLVNLVGIKRDDQMSFTRAHVELPIALAAAAEAAGIMRMIHVSVAGADQPDPRGPYLQSKAEGERALRARAGPIQITILRPGVVYGPGDDLLRNLADSIRAAPVFPAPAGGRAPLQPVSVDDVALAVLRCIERDASAGRSYDVVGPERLDLRELLARVARHPKVARRCWAVPAPIALMRLAAGVLERGMADPLITRSQLGLLGRGVVGDLGPARRDLDLQPQALGAAQIDAALEAFEPRLPSVRLVPDPAAARALAERAGLEPRSPGARQVPAAARAPAEHAGPMGDNPSWRVGLFAALAVAAMLLGPRIPASIWLRMAGLELALTLVAVASLRLDWRALWRPSLPALTWGVGAGLVMWAGAFGVAALVSAVAPELWAGATSLYAWARELPLAHALALLVVIVAGEEFVWRGALGVALSGRMNPWVAVAASAALFTLAHLTTGPPVLALAAAIAGGAWTYLAIRSRSLFATFVAHLGWDVAMLWITPLA